MTSRGACLEMSRLLPEGRERWLPSAECLYNVNISYWHQCMIYTNVWVANIHVSKVRIVSMWIVIATSWSHSTSIRVPVQKLRQVEVKLRKYIIDSYTHLWLLWVAVHGPGGADLLSEVATQVDEVQKGQLPCLYSIYASLVHYVFVSIDWSTSLLYSHFPSGHKHHSHAWALVEPKSSHLQLWTVYRSGCCMSMRPIDSLCGWPLVFQQQ